MKWVEAVPDPAKTCGSCAMCCKLFDVDWLEKPKPAGKWCHHCQPGRGCKIWQQLPKKCGDYYCIWRIDPELAAEWRPDQARFILTHAHQDAPLAVLIDPTMPDAHRREPYWSILRKTARQHLEGRGSTLVTFCGTKRSLIFPDGEVPISDSVVLSDITIERRESVDGPHWSPVFPKH